MSDTSGAAAGPAEDPHPLDGTLDTMVSPRHARRRIDLRRNGPVLVVWGAAAVWSLVFGRLVYLRHARFASFDFDMGIYGQAVWLLAHGGHFNTIRGLNVLGHHANYGLFFFAPFSWLGQGAHLMNLTQVVVLSLGSVAVYRAARHHLGNEWLAVGPAVAYLGHFSLGWLAWELFHPDVMAITPLLFAYSYALERRWRPYAVSLALALVWKEDVGLAVAALGFVLAVRGNRRVGLVTIVAGAIWFLGMTQVVMPRFSPDGVFYTENFYGELGSSAREIVVNSVTDPGLVVERLEQSDALGYLRDLALPYAFTSFLSPLPLVIGAAQAAANLLSTAYFTWSVRFHYVSMPVLALTIAMIEGVARPRRHATRRFLVGAVCACSLATTVAWGVSPISRHYREGYWPLQASPRAELQRAALDLVPPGQSVSSTYNLAPHLVRREEVYVFPNPWQGRNWGVDDVNPRSPERVRWLAVDRTVLGDADLALLDAVLASGEFRVVADTADLLVAERVRPAP